MSAEKPHNLPKQASDASVNIKKVLDTGATSEPLHTAQMDNKTPSTPEKISVAQMKFALRDEDKLMLPAESPIEAEKNQATEQMHSAQPSNPPENLPPSDSAARDEIAPENLPPSDSTARDRTSPTHKESELTEQSPSMPNGFEPRAGHPAAPKGNVPPAWQQRVKPKEVDVTLPNAQQNVPYYFDLTEIFAKHSIKIVRFTDPDGTKLQFDPATKVLHGMIADDGERRLRFKAQDTLDNVVMIEASLIIVPDPRTLWREIEPTSPFFRKPHCDYRHLATNGVTMVGVRVRGRAHANRGDFCDDDFAVVHRASLGYVGMVADGAGSARFSRLGSRLVVENFPHFLQLEVQKMKEKAQYEQWLELFDRQEARALEIMRLIVGRALDSVLRVMQGHCGGMTVAGEALGMRDLYTTCLLFWARPLKGKRWAVASFWVGDGGLALRHGGNFSLLGKPDSGENAGQTRFLAWDVLSEEEQKARLQAQIYNDLEEIWAMSDGVSDPKFINEMQLANSAAWLALTDEIKSAVQNEASAYEWLNFWSKGDHDDRSLCWFAVKEKKYE